MKKYHLYLYINYNNCFTETDDPKKCLITDCMNCKDNHYFITNQQHKKIVESPQFLQITDYNTILKNYEIEALDNPNEDNFINYLINNNSNYRIIDPETKIIIKYSKEDLELIDDLTRKYNINYINLYNIKEKKELKSLIKNLKIHKNISIILSSGFTLTTLLTSNTFIENPKFITAILTSISAICLAKNIKNTVQDNIDIKINKKLAKTLKK